MILSSEKLTLYTYTIAFGLLITYNVIYNYTIRIKPIKDLYDIRLITYDLINKTRTSHPVRG